MIRSLFIRCHYNNGGTPPTRISLKHQSTARKITTTTSIRKAHSITKTHPQKIFTNSTSITTTLSCLLCSYIILHNSYNKKHQITELEEYLQKQKNHIIPTNFMKNLSQKAYLNYHNPKTALLLQDNSNTKLLRRPKGVPQSLRILVIDMDDFGYASILPSKSHIQKEDDVEGTAITIDVFDKSLRVQSNCIYIDGIARENHSLRHNNTSSIVQKSLVTSCAKAGDAHDDGGGGVEVLYASVKRLNPLGIKKNRSARLHLKKKDDNDEDVIVEEEDAPWNQVAWLDEMRLRINGRIPFTAPTERSSFLSHLFLGTVYKRTVPYNGNFISRLFFSSPGIDSNNHKNPASNKPHAVLADGNAMQYLPGSLLHLSKCCKEANVPLYVIHDPRSSWGRNTHPNLYTALTDLKKTLKNTIIQNVLKIQHGSSFERGKQLGFLEAQTFMRLREIGNRTRRLFYHQTRRTTTTTPTNFNEEHATTTTNNSWKKYTTDQLLKEFITKGIVVESTTDSNNKNKNTNVYTCTKPVQDIFDLCCDASGSNTTTSTVEDKEKEVL